MSDEKVRMRATMVIEYVASPEFYEGAESPKQMAAIDAENLIYYPEEFVGYADENGIVSITVEPVEE